ncbi:hypothetical protein [Trichloromonas acetexigens]|uniref:Uncharacterized protein n=1 Tax=Trichloromonas acetexigens TaxID=38815 RepID=A0A550JJH8_9BACT|nr:hypothetical protein [Desulfuromonas acetexigens]TRO83362.1 hypothetical protein FL622_04565 [Desulfuromonas acetexigens]
MEVGWVHIRRFLDENYKNIEYQSKIWTRIGFPCFGELYSKLKTSTVFDCKKYLKCLEENISSRADDIDLRSFFYLSIVNQMFISKTIHSNLHGCDILLANKVKSFFSEYKESEFPPLNKDSGVIPVLIFSGKFIPLKTYHANIAGIPRSIFFDLKGWDKVSAFKYILFRVKGFSPLLELHLPKLENARFSADLYYDDCLLTSYVLHRNKHIKGTMQMGWYIDPVLKEISPHLGEIGELARKFGSLVLCVGADDAAVLDATMKSTKRRKLYEEGLYQPKRFLRLWSRTDVFKHFPEVDLDNVI